MINSVLTRVVTQDLCIGCGTCTAVCPAQNLSMGFDNQGKYIAKQNSKCFEKCDLCLKACPFGPKEYSKNENELAKELFTSNNFKHNEFTGFYQNIYVGYANINNERENGTSGGLARFMLKRLLEKGLVDHIIHVIPNDNPEKLFRFSIASSIDEFNKTAKSTYYPVEMSEILDYIVKNDGKYAITALPCFVKGLRSAQKINKSLKERIKFTIGLTCGQMKSKHFTKYISILGGLSPDDRIKKIVYRSKIKDQSATNYYYDMQGEKSTKVFWKNTINLLWNNRWFTPNACNFCDDVFAELADISFMDAWLPEYSKDWRGTGIIVSRNEQLTGLIDELNAKNEIIVSNLPVEKVVQSQKPVVETKRKELKWRLFDSLKAHKTVPDKRVKPVKPSILDAQYLTMRLKDIIRQKSFEFYPEILYNKKLAKKLNFYENSIKRVHSLNKILVKLAILKKIGGIYGRKQIHTDG